MTDKPSLPRSVDEQRLIERVEALLDDPDLAGSPVREVLADLFLHSEEQRGRLEKLVRISDGYHNVARSRNLSLVEEYDKQIQRLGKLARISDRYQTHLMRLNQALKEVSLRDPLTGMGNRRFLMERLKEESERARRSGSGFSVALLDVDHFKSINDRFGHDAGDQILCAIATSIQSALRDYDLSGRWGGEEFLIMLPETPLTIAHSVCERVRQSISAIALEKYGADLVVTASVGLTEHLPGETFSDTVNRADNLLLDAKGQGRDRVHVA